ncbi:uncharacterized protein LOC132654813 [Meriones unguiculatus]|uniref:uncharacterized protein LOC132654813 n=1 Tax=Meriones unguiculatus TaxID=10047 RepID=UPI00293EE9B0|nr:uncharacterized protein LOC132654813 [Meriones unguiculatus]
MPWRGRGAAAPSAPPGLTCGAPLWLASPRLRQPGSRRRRSAAEPGHVLSLADPRVALPTRERLPWPARSPPSGTPRSSSRHCSPRPPGRSHHTPCSGPRLPERRAQSDPAAAWTPRCRAPRIHRPRCLPASLALYSFLSLFALSKHYPGHVSQQQPTHSRHFLRGGCARRLLWQRRRALWSRSLGTRLPGRGSQSMENPDAGLAQKNWDPALNACNFPTEPVSDVVWTGK